MVKTSAHLSTQGLEKNFDYKKVLKAFKKGESSPRRLKAVVLVLPAPVRARAPFPRCWCALLVCASVCTCQLMAAPLIHRRVLLQRHRGGGYGAGAGHPAAGRPAQECERLPGRKQACQKGDAPGPPVAIWTLRSLAEHLDVQTMRCAQHWHSSHCSII